MSEGFSIQSLSSGSGGNCWVLTAGETRLLIDAGLTAKKIVERMSAAEILPESVQGILITHEHSDHIASVPVLSRRFGYKTYTVDAVANLRRGSRWALSEEPGVKLRTFRAGEEFAVDGLTVRPFSVSHDAVDPVMFVFEYAGMRLGFATDLGFLTRLVRERFRDLDALVIESNHDLKMLDEGPYRPEDKRRIKGRLGHLSNEDAQALVREIAHPGLSHVALAHLSQINNLPTLAFDGMRAALDESYPACQLLVASQHVVGEPIPIIKKESV